MAVLSGCGPHGNSVSGRPGAGIANSSRAAAVGAAALPVGPGPTNYTEQPQPAPGSCTYRYASNGEPLPDPTCTPGAVNPRVSQDNLDSTICRPGYSKSIRPPEHITGAEKRANAASYGYTEGMGTAEYDHLVSLELGGDPNDPRNLWVEPPDPGSDSSLSNNNKDKVENQLHQLVCSGQMPLATAQTAIAYDWTTALPR
jgi:hypothetical protein